MRRSLLAAGALPLAGSIGFGDAPLKYKAAVIGHTGRGNYGHELDWVFNHRPDVQVVAVADPDAAGRAKAAARCKALRQYADYREMLEKEKPQLVSVAPRWTDQHHAMGRAALGAGAHLDMEKPFTETLAEADDLLQLATANKLKIAVAHQMRLQPSVVFIKAQLRQLIGELLEIRAHGKQDHRAGGEDMVVLGTHVFDLMRHFAGDPLWCSARILREGREITRADARQATENIGPVAGDEITAQFAFENGVNASFTSRRKLHEVVSPWGMELIGDQGAIRIVPDTAPKVFILKTSPLDDAGQVRQWVRIEGDPGANLPKAERNTATANLRVVNEWIAAIEADRQPACSGYNAMKALEMILGVFEAGLSRQRAVFPLSNRSHPLAE